MDPVDIILEEFADQRFGVVFYEFFEQQSRSCGIAECPVAVVHYDTEVAAKITEAVRPDLREDLPAELHGAHILFDERDIEPPEFTLDKIVIEQGIVCHNDLSFQ